MIYMKGSKSKQDYLEIINSVRELLDNCKEHVRSLKDSEMISLILINSNKTRLNLIKNKSKEIRRIVEDDTALYSFAGDEASDLYIFTQEIFETVDRQREQGEKKKTSYKLEAKASEKKHNRRLLEGNIEQALNELERTLSLEDASEKEPESYLKDEGVTKMMSVLNELEDCITELENQIDDFEQKVQKIDETNPNY